MAVRATLSRLQSDRSPRVSDVPDGSTPRRAAIDSKRCARPRRAGASPGARAAGAVTVGTSQRESASALPALSTGGRLRSAAVRVGVVDIGTNSTRLLIADVEDGRVHEVERRSEVTRLGEGVDATGRLGEEPMSRVLATLEAYHEAIRERRCDATTGVLTSAVRDAENGDEFTELVRTRFGLDVRTIPGDEEARLTFLGATAGRADPPDGSLLVIDIGGGSTEFVIGRSGAVAFNVSAQVGVVGPTERHLHADPPGPAELRALGDQGRGIVA